MLDSSAAGRNVLMENWGGICNEGEGLIVGVIDYMESMNYLLTKLVNMTV